MSDPRKTGKSNITGKLVTIRHATDADLVRVEEYLDAQGKASDLGDSEVVVAAEAADYDRIIGFGILKKGDDAGCVSLFEDSRRRGIGSTIVSHLLEYAPLKRVYTARYASYFTRTRFERGQRTHAVRTRTSAGPCRKLLMERLIPAVSAQP